MTGAPYVFISHSSDEADDARGLCAFLEQQGLRTWIAPRDVRPGRDYSEQLQQAIENCGAFVVLVTRSANASPYVRVETEMAFSLDKPLFPVRTSDVAPGTGLALFLKIKHWTDAFGAQREHNLRRLVEELHFVLSGTAPQRDAPPGRPPPPRPRQDESRYAPPVEPAGEGASVPQGRSRLPLLIGLGAAGAVVLLLLLFLLLARGKLSDPQPAPNPAPPTPQPQAAPSTDGSWSVGWQSESGVYQGSFEARGGNGVLMLDVQGADGAQSRVRQECTISGQGNVAIRCSNPQVLIGEGPYAADNFDLQSDGSGVMRGLTSSISGETATATFTRR